MESDSNGKSSANAVMITARLSDKPGDRPQTVGSLYNLQNVVVGLCVAVVQAEIDNTEFAEPGKLRAGDYLLSPLNLAVNPWIQIVEAGVEILRDHGWEGALTTALGTGLWKYQKILQFIIDLGCVPDEVHERKAEHRSEAKRHDALSEYFDALGAESAVRRKSAERVLDAIERLDRVELPSNLEIRPISSDEILAIRERATVTADEIISEGGQTVEA